MADPVVKHISLGCPNIKVLKVRYTSLARNHIKLSNKKQGTIRDKYKEIFIYISLQLTACKKMTDSALISVAENCKNLVRLDVSYCLGITDAGMTSLI